MSDPNKLAAIADDLRKVATDCSNASHTLQQQAQQLDWSAQDLTIGTNKWAGKGSQSFLSAWNDYHRDTYRSYNELDQTASALNKLAQTIEDNLQALYNAQAQEAAGWILTGGLAILSIAQFGLDPITDAATVGSGGVDMALIQEAQSAEEAIVEMDAQISSELEQITSQIENSSEPGDVNVTEGDGVVSSGPDDSLVQGNTYGDGGFPDGQRVEYEADGTLIEQSYRGSCVAASTRMILNDAGIEVPEAYVRGVADVDTIQGGYLSKVPDALNKLGLANPPYTFGTNLTIDDLTNATSTGDSAIVSINAPVAGLHAVVVDGVENGMVLIRDPAGSEYQVTIANFLKLWNGKAVIPTP